MNTNTIDTLKKNATPLDLKNLKDIVMNPKLKKWRRAFLRKKEKETHIFNCLLSHIEHMLKSETNQRLWMINRKVFFEYVFRYTPVVEFFDKLFDKSSI